MPAVYQAAGIPRSALVERFLAGYRAAGGPPELEQHFVERVIPCESSWRVDPPGSHLGLAQFHLGTWRLSARPGADYRDPFEQGYAVARWLASGIDPGTTAGWPVCWHR